MKLKIFTIYDSKAEAYLPPFFMKTKGEAIRAWTTTIQEPNTQFHKYPSDYTLFEIGEYDDSSATLTQHKNIISLGNGIEFKRGDNVTDIKGTIKEMATRESSEDNRKKEE